MADIQRIKDEPAASRLADQLNGAYRRRPFVVVSIPADRAQPWIDAEKIAREVGDLAEVYVIPTGQPTWAFANKMPEGTQVYGGAGRVYPVGGQWASELSRSPLRFAFDAETGATTTEHLISDALRMAVTAGLAQAAPTRALRPVTAVVKGTVAGRAMVDIGLPMLATIAEELTVEDVPIERLVRRGQSIEGLFDQQVGRVDISRSLLPATSALAEYAPGEIVLTKVVSVAEDRADLMLFPKTTSPAVIVTVDREAVTSNPHDDLRSLMTLGEVISARITSLGPSWGLLLSDIDDDESIRPAPALLPDGPPWLVEEPDLAPVTVDFAEPPILAPPRPLPAVIPETVSPPVSTETVTEAAPSAPQPTAPRPTPALLDRRRSAPSSPASRPIAPAPDSGTTAPKPSVAPTQPPAATPLPPAVPGVPSMPLPSAPPVPTPGPPGAPTNAPAAPTPAPSPTPAQTPEAPPTAPSQPAASTQALLLQIDALKAKVTANEREIQRLSLQVVAAADEREQVHYLRDQAERRANRAENELKSAKSRLRKAGGSRNNSASSEPVFADREVGFRYLVQTQWALRTLPAEQDERPLPEYDIGPNFLDSLDRLEGITPKKVADVVFEILTGLAARTPAREAHRLRQGESGDAPIRTREDGAIAWRVSLQVKTPSARRIHYWLPPSGRIELAQVAKHDDFSI